MRTEALLTIVMGMMTITLKLQVYCRHALNLGSAGTAHMRKVLYAVRAMKEFPLVPTIFCVLPIYRSRLRAFLVSGNENI